MQQDPGLYVVSNPLHPNFSKSYCASKYEQLKRTPNRPKIPEKIKMRDPRKKRKKKSSHPAMILLPPSTVTRFLILTLQYCIPNFFTRRETTAPSPFFSSSVKRSTWSIADGANNNASPTFKSTISLIIEPEAEDSSAAAEATAAGPRCALIVLNQSGDVNRWTRVKEQRSRSLGEIVGSCVAMMIRHALCRCRRMADNKASVSLAAPEDSPMN